jgi:hypothetical protein
MDDYGHWCPLSDRPDGAFGFIYYIENLITGRRYIGRKQIVSVSMKKVEGKSRRVKTTKESDWRTYTSSCKELNDDIKKHGKEAFTFVIYDWVYGKGMLTYREVQEQWLSEVLSREETESGERLWYNGNIGAVKFIKPKS